MFLFHAAFSLGLISLTAGSALYVSSARSGGPGTSFAKTIALIVILFSITSTLCTSYYGIRYWQQGYFQNPMSMMHDMPMHESSKNMSGSNKH